MEKFVTDLDKLLDEFESEDISSSNIYEFSDSSGYNSLKTSIELYPADIALERNISQFPEINDITELPTPTCSEPNIMDSANEELLCREESRVQQIEMSTNGDNLKSTKNDSATHIHVFPQPIDAFSSPVNESDINSHHKENPQSMSPSNNSHVPPKKKLRPNSLFGLTSISTSDDNVVDSGSVNPAQCHYSTNLIPHTESPDSTLLYKKSIKRPLSLNLISPENSDINISNIEISDQPSVPTLEQSADRSQESVIESSQLTKIEKVLEDNEIANDNSEWQGIPIKELGQKEPTWIKDELTNNCMQCQLPFTMFRRRHHCRACGRLLCGKCCCWRMQLQFSNRFFPKDRVCAVCFQYLIRIEVAKRQNSTISNIQRHSSVLKSSPQPQSLAVSPFSNSDNQSVSDSTNNSTVSKSVIFFDGIRPGGDLTEIGKSRIITPTKYQASQTKLSNLETESVSNSREPPFINLEEFAETLPPLVLEYQNKLVINPNSGNFAQPTKVSENNPIILAITRNLHIHLEIIQLTFCICTLNHTHISTIQHECEYDCIECWYFASIGLETIGCEEVVIILKKLPNENSPPIEIFQYYFQIYQRAYKNERKYDGLEMTIELFNEKNVNLKDWAGILHIRPSFQCLDKLPLPYSSFLIGILIHRWELPWAKILPLRLLLALGNQSRFYPCSIISDRYRSSVYVEISQTILQIISPVFSFPNNLEQGFIDPNSIPTVPGMWIHLLASQETIVQIPKLSYHALLDILSYRQSEFNTLALVACFSREADSHLVCCQNEDTCKYYSGAISIQHTQRTVTGATMIIFVPCDNSTEHGATIVEDVLVVRLSLMQLSCVINSLKTMSNLILQWDSSAPVETINKLESSMQNNNAFVSRSFVKIVWTDNHQFAAMTSIERPSLVTDETIQMAFLNLTSDENGTIKSHRVPSSLQDLSFDRDTLNNINLKFIWSRYHYYICGNSNNDSYNDEPLDVEDILRKVAIYFSRSLHPFLDLLRGLGIVKLGLRININNETVQFLVGCSKKFIYSAIITPDQSPTEDPDSNQSSYICPKMGNSRKFHSLSICALPEICIESLNEVLVPFLYSQTSQISTGSVISELEFHIID